MTRLAQLVLAACVLQAALAASIPEPHTDSIIDLKSVELEPAKDDNIASPAEAIPVEVVLDEAQQSDTLNEVSFEDDIKRPQADLRNPGEPQRQEHETQNPEHFLEEAAKLFSVKENLDQAQALLREGFQGVSDDIQKWISNNEQLSTIQQNIRNLRSAFSSQIEKLNESLQGFVKPQESGDQVPAESQLRDFRNIESSIKTLQENFNSGLNTLTEGVRIVASVNSQQVQSLRQAVAPPAAPAAPASPAPPQNILVQYADMVSSTVSNGFNNVTQSIGQYLTNNNPFTGLQHLLNPTPAPGALADQPEGVTTQRPNAWQNLQGYFSNFFNNGQTQTNQAANPGQPAAPQGPFANVPNVFQNIVAIIRPTTTVKPAEAPAPAPAAAEAPAAEAAGSEPASSNVVPEQVAVAEAPAQPEKPAETATLPSPLGPIRQILNSIPVVQRIQNSLNPNAANPEKPRDPVVKNDSEQVKGGLFLPPPHPHHSWGNTDIRGVEKSETIKEELPKEELPKEELPKKELPKKELPKEEPKKEIEKEIIKEQPQEKPSEIVEKTE